MADFGALPFFNSAVTNTAANVATKPNVRLAYMQIVNPNTTDIFLQLFNTAAANVTVGTTVPTVSLFVPGGSGASNRGGYSEDLNSVPLIFSGGLSMAATTTATGNGAPATAVIVNLGLL